ncbi:3142_t:CDS:1, partial [Dentiscutata heterogama]
DYIQIWQQLESIDSLQIEGIENLLASFNRFLNNISINSKNDTSFIYLYKNATLKSTDIIHADSSYNNNLWIRDITIVINTNEFNN